jgi:thiazole synthase
MLGRGRDAIGFAYRSNKGLKTIDFLKLLSNNKSSCDYRRRIGAPSDAAKAMELGADAVLVNTAIAVAGNQLMAEAFKEAVIAGRKAYEARLGNK